MCDWHWEWQYERIEKRYGIEICGERTFEKVISVDEIIHRIDNVTGMIAIEFQHTLSVSIDEMDSRFHAHKKYGYTPYLVIDFTSYSYEDVFESIKYCDSNYRVCRDKLLANKIKKWKGTCYAQENNLFIDLSDCMVRIVDCLKDKSMKLSVQHFTDNLSSLEDELRICCEDEADRINCERQLQLEQELKARLMGEEKEREKAEKQRLETEMAQKRAADRARERYYQKKFNDPEFKFFRKCFEDAEVKPHVVPHDHEIFEYWSHTYTEDDDVMPGYIEKHHEYKSTESKFSIIYKVIMKVDEKRIPGRRGMIVVPDYVFDHAVIELREGYRVLNTFVRY